MCLHCRNPDSEGTLFFILTDCLPLELLSHHSACWRTHRATAHAASHSAAHRAAGWTSAHSATAHTHSHSWATTATVISECSESICERNDYITSESVAAALKMVV